MHLLTMWRMANLREATSGFLWKVLGLCCQFRKIRIVKSTLIAKTLTRVNLNESFICELLQIKDSCNLQKNKNKKNEKKKTYISMTCQGFL